MKDSIQLPLEYITVVNVFILSWVLFIIEHS